MQLDGQILLYRGLADADWEIEASAYRRIKESLKADPALVTFQNYNKQLLDSAGLQGFRYQNGRKLSDLELLAELQHYGAATCLIDFTENAMIALWFACQEEQDKDGNKKNGKVVAMATGGIETFSTVSYEDLNEKQIEEFLNPGKLWKWTPSSLNMNNRVVAQQSVFVFGEEVIYESIDWHQKVEIDAGRKRDILTTLEKSFGVKEQHLFNDLAGFALHNAHDKKYDAYTAEDYFRLGLRFQQREEFEKAKNYFTKTIERDSRFVPAYNNRGVAKNELGDHLEAISDFSKAIDLNPQYAKAYNNRGIARDALKDHQEAISDYSKAIDLNPQYAMAYNNRGNAKNELGDHEDAISDYSKAIGLNPQYAMAYYNRGNAKLALSDHEGAISDFDKAIDLNPRYADAYNNRGNAKLALSDHEDAISDFDKAIKLNPQFADAYNNRGLAKNKLRDREGAISDHSKAIELNPQDAEAFYTRGLAKHAFGDQTGAKEDWDRAREIDPKLEPPGS